MSAYVSHFVSLAKFEEALACKLPFSCAACEDSAFEYELGTSCLREEERYLPRIVRLPFHFMSPGSLSSCSTQRLRDVARDKNPWTSSARSPLLFPCCRTKLEQVDVARISVFVLEADFRERGPHAPAEEKVGPSRDLSQFAGT